MGEAAIEAMGASLPVVLSPGCNLPEIQSTGAGLIAAPVPGILADAIGQLLADRGAAREMGERGRRLVVEKFTWPRIARETLAIYRSISAHRVARSA